MKFLIYGLVDPRTQAVRYVGKSTSGLRRPKEHSAPSLLEGVRTHKANWIRTLRAQGLRPTITVLEEFSDAGPLDVAEVAWIATGRALGWPLTNGADGGVGSPGRVLSAETKAKIGAANKGAKRRSRTPAEIEANRRLHVGKKRSLETKARIAASKKGALLGVPKSAEHRAKIAAALGPH